MTAAELIEKARKQTKLDAGYALGGGKIVPVGSDPLDENLSCDCSAFVCWCLGIPKHQAEVDWLKRLNGGWYNTDGIWWDAVAQVTGYFWQNKRGPRVGDVVVYPSPATLQRHSMGSARPGSPKIGHVGIVSGVTSASEYYVIHCSAGNEREFGHAIAETSPKVFERWPDARVFAGCSLVSY